MPGWWVWLVAAALYVVFRLFYDSWRGPLTQAEIDAMLAQAEAQGAGEINDLSIVRTFLEADDGREFVMANPNAQAEYGSGVGQLVAAGLRPPVPQRYPLCDGRFALEALAAGGVFGKVVLEP